MYSKKLLKPNNKYYLFNNKTFDEYLNRYAEINSFSIEEALQSFNKNFNFEETMNRPHKSVCIDLGYKTMNCDEKLAPLLQLINKEKLLTSSSCQYNAAGYAGITFPLDGFLTFVDSLIITENDLLRCLILYMEKGLINIQFNCESYDVNWDFDVGLVPYFCNLIQTNQTNQTNQPNHTNHTSLKNSIFPEQKKEGHTNPTDQKSLDTILEEINESHPCVYLTRLLKKPKTISTIEEFCQVCNHTLGEFMKQVGCVNLKDIDNYYFFNKLRRFTHNRSFFVIEDEMLKIMYEDEK